MPYQVRGRHINFTAPEGATHLIGDFTDDLERPIALQAGHSLRLEFPARAYVEYAFLDANGKRLADPSNDFGGEHPWYKEYRAVALEGYQAPALTEPLEGAAQGRTEALTWTGAALPGTRRAYVHLPPEYDGAASYPVFYVQDGVAYRRTGRLSVVHDNLVHLGRIAPAILVYLEPVDRDAEYYFNSAYQVFLRSEVLPRIEARFAVAQDASRRGLWGASLGGLASLWVALQQPETFGLLVAQSSAVQGKPGTSFRRGGEEWLCAQFQQREPAELRVSLDCGQLEWLLGANRRLAAALWDKGYPHQYLEHPSGHNWVTWRSGMAAHLEWMLGSEH